MGLYWNIVMPSSASYSQSPSLVAGLFTPDVSSPRIRVEVSGNTYSAFVDGSSVPVTTLTTSAFAGGQVTLYSYSKQTFDNVVIATPGTGP